MQHSHHTPCTNIRLFFATSLKTQKNRWEFYSFLPFFLIKCIIKLEIILNIFIGARILIGWTVLTAADIPIINIIIITCFNSYSAETKGRLPFAISIEPDQPAHPFNLTRFYTVGWPTWLDIPSRLIVFHQYRACAV